MKKTKLLLTAVAIVVLIFAFYIYKKNLDSENEGEITIIVVDSQKCEVVNQIVIFVKDDNLYKILERNFQIEVKNKMLMGIEGVNADTKNYFLKIYVNCQAANYGINDIKVKNGDEVRIVYTKVGDYSDPC